MLVKSIAKIFYKIIMTKSLGDLLAYIISNCFMNACTAKLRPKTMKTISISYVSESKAILFNYIVHKNKLL